MSHAVVLVAVDGPLDKIEEQVEHEMAPFDENEEWFRDGSRWDWYQIGGRFTGWISGYDPETDPANREVCELCHGSGRRPDAASFGADWNKAANGCNGCHGTGERVAWPSQWKRHNGDIIVVSAIDITKFKAPSAFLTNRHWHESERMGWFGGSTYTECERKDMDKPQANPEAWFGRCLHKDEATGARVICWNEPSEVWDAQFYKRFIEPLPESKYLVVVDYHV
jgi:predicted CxxxxCH...CXXCH cytochrome family protein